MHRRQWRSKRRDTPTTSQGWWLHRRPDPVSPQRCARSLRPGPCGRRDTQGSFRWERSQEYPRCRRSHTQAPGHPGLTVHTVPPQPPSAPLTAPPQPCTDEEEGTERTRLDVGESERPLFLGSQRRHVGRIKSRFPDDKISGLETAPVPPAERMESWFVCRWNTTQREEGSLPLGTHGGTWRV